LNAPDEELVARIEAAQAPFSAHLRDTLAERHP
jgi:hypothetical protein